MHSVLFGFVVLSLLFCVGIIAVASGFLLHFFHYQETWMYVVQSITSLLFVLLLLAMIYYRDKRIDGLEFENQMLEKDKQLLDAYHSILPSLPEVLSSEACKSLFLTLGSPHLVLNFFSSWLLREDMIPGVYAWLKEELTKEDAIEESPGFDNVDVPYKEICRPGSVYHKRNLTKSEITQALQVFEAYDAEEKARNEFLRDYHSRR